MDVLMMFGAIIVIGAMCLLFWGEHKSTIEQGAWGPWLHELSISGWLLMAAQMLFGLWAWGSTIYGNMYVLDNVTGNQNIPASMVISAGSLYAVWLLGRSAGYCDCLRDMNKGA